MSGGGDREVETTVATFFASVLPALSAISPLLSLPRVQEAPACLPPVRVYIQDAFVFTMSWTLQGCLSLTGTEA